ncbi:MAG: hypothetical protein ACOCUR_02435 [Nanoarchaeota archaeon]
MTKAIKNVSDEAWRDFKTIASAKNMRLSDLFEEMVEKEKKEMTGSGWDNLFNARLIKDSSKVKRKGKEIRERFGMR